MKAAFALAGILICTPAHAQQSVIDSIDMQAVCDSAHAHMDYFSEHLASPAPNETEFMLQIAVPVRGNSAVEYVWITDLKPFTFDGQGILDADAEHAPLKKGDTLKFRRDMICDWGFRRDGMMIGHYTTRAALTVLAPDVAMVVGAKLGEESGVSPKPVSIADKFTLFSEAWQPKRIGRIDGYDVRIARLKGEFIWHSHADADEFFFVVEGILRMHFHDRYEDVAAGSLIIVPKGTEHKPEALTPETKIMLVEKSETMNTGDGPATDRTVADPEFI